VIGWEMMLVRLLLATLFGGVIGFQRERAEKPAGFRTHVLVCLGSALLMLISVYPFVGKPYADPSRVAAGAITGIGFLGAGAIISQGGVVRGLTTAASIWAVAGIGLATGVGLYMPAFIATLLVLLVLSIFKEVEVRLLRGYRILTLTSEDRPGQLGKIGSALGDMGVNIKHVELECDEGKKTCVIRLALDVPAGVHREDVAEKLAKIKGLSRLGWEE